MLRFLVLISLICVIQASSNLYAILVSTSKYWFNYRQSANIIKIYHHLKQFGIDDEDVKFISKTFSTRNGLDNSDGSRKYCLQLQK